MRKPFLWAERKGWYLRVPVEGGKLQTVRLGDTRTAAYDEWDRLKRSAQAASNPDSAPVAVFVGQYVAHIKSEAKMGRVAKSTVTRQIDRLAPFLAVAGDVAISELKPHHVTSWLRDQDRWNATTRSDAAAAVKRAMQWATDEGRIDKNPLALLKMRRGSPRDHLVSPDEYQTLLAGVWRENYPRRSVTSFRAVLIALRLSGCRPGEITKLAVKDFDGTTWTIKDHKNRKKQTRPRIVYLSPCLQTLSRITARGRRSGPLFMADDGRGWKYSDMRLRFQRLREKTGTTKKCVLYSFRHTWITDALMSGIDVATVAEMAGTSIEMIDRHYGHLNQHRKHLTDAAVTVGAARSTPGQPAA